MTGTTWTKFFWSDWESDERLKLCSPGAQALWMRMLCICVKAGGYLTIAGEKLGPEDMAKLTGWSVDDVRLWWDELKRWGVFSVEGRGKVYCRRMVRDAKRSEIGRETGKLGGNPTLRKTTENPPTLKGATNGGGKGRSGTRARINHEPSAISQPPKPPDGGAFEKWWEAYPRKVAKRAAEKAYRAALDRTDAETLLGSLRQYPWPSEERFIPHPATWLNGDRWADGKGDGGQLPLGEPAKHPPDPWRWRVQEFRMNQRWDTVYWGPKPGREGCQAPPEILREFGIEPPKPKPIEGAAA
jgi:hypothetical protein